MNDTLSLPAEPGDDETPPLNFGHNSGAEWADRLREAEGKRRKMFARLPSFLKALDIWTQRGKVENEDQAERLNDFITQAKAYKKELEAGCTAERKPFMEAAKAVSETFAPEVDKIDKIIKRVAPMYQAYLDAKAAKLREEAAEAARQKAAAERAAEAARMDAANAASESQRIAAEAAAKEHEKLAKVSGAQAKAASAPVRVASATGAGKSRGFRTVHEATIVDSVAIALHYRDHEEVRELFVRLALAEHRAAPTIDGEKQAPVIPGIEFTSKQVIA